VLSLLTRAVYPVLARIRSACRRNGGSRVLQTDAEDANSCVVGAEELRARLGGPPAPIEAEDIWGDISDQEAGLRAWLPGICGSSIQFDKTRVSI
jgi:hypothetical protein